MLSRSPSVDYSFAGGRIRQPSMSRSSSASSLVSLSSAPTKRSMSMSDDEYVLPKKPKKPKRELTEREFRIDGFGNDISVSKPVARKYPDYYSNKLILSWLELDDEDMPSVDDNEVFDRLRKYMEVIHLSEGYDITDLPPGPFNGVVDIFPCQNFYDFAEEYDRIKSFAVMAMEMYNKTNPWVKYEVMEVEKMNVRPNYCEEFFITFTASNVKTGVIKTFQALVVDDMFKKTAKVYRCRQKPEFC